MIASSSHGAAICVRSLICMEDDLIVHRGEVASHEMFILLKGEVELIGNDPQKTRSINVSGEEPLARSPAAPEPHRRQPRGLHAGADGENP